jgi:16S rRNA (cytidine1402-2'-O)-methyltransferase
MRATWPGTLYVVALPIGDPDDITLRAMRTLREVDVILSEDTRRTRALLTHLGLDGRVREVADGPDGAASPAGAEGFPDTSSVDPEARGRPLVLRRFDAHVEGSRLEPVLAALRAGGTCALVSDAGTPGVSDPGHRLVRAAHEAGLRVVPVPGASSLTAAVSVSGLGAQGFTFHGFAPKADSARREALASLPPGTHAFFTPARDLPALLADAAAVPTLGEAFVAREITKLHETFYRGTPAALAPALAADPEATLGEAVVVFEAAPAVTDDAAVLAALRPLLAEGSSPRDAARLVAERLGLPRRHVYQLALAEPRRPGRASEVPT